MQPNPIALIGMAFVAFIFAFIYYHPKVLGTAWMNAAGFTEEQRNEKPSILNLALSLLFNLFISAGLLFLTVHQTALFSLVGGDPEILLNSSTAAVMAEHGENFRNVGHGVTHGVITYILFFLPIMGTNVLFEKKSIKLLWINSGYWLITLMVLGAIASQWGATVVTG